MPPVAAAIGAAVAKITVASIVTFAIKTAIGVVGSLLISKLFAPDPPKLNSNVDRRRTEMVRDPIAPRRIVYGKTRVSGPIVFIDATENSSKLHVVVALAGHEVNAIKQVYFGERLAWDVDQSPTIQLTEVEETTSRSGGTTTVNQSAADKIDVNVHLGTTGQAADSELVSRSTNWTADHKLSEIAYVYCQLTYSDKVYPSGLESISAVVEGRKVEDPRLSPVADTYTNNPALCIRDYLMDSRYGLGATSDEIDDDSFIAAANVCEEQVNLSAGGTQDRYTLDGVVDLGETPQKILESMLTSCAGRLIYSGGKFILKAGEYETPTITLDEDDLREGIKVKTRRPRRELFNAVRGTFVSENDFYVPTDYPALESTTYANEDNGETIYSDLVLPYTTNQFRAQRLSKIALLENRQQITCVLPCKLNALQVKAGDTIMVTNDRLGWSGKEFVCEGFEFAIGNDGALGVDLTLKETASGVYDWSTSEEADFLDGLETNLPDPFTINPPGISVTDELRTVYGRVVSVLVVTVSTGNATVTDFEVEASEGETGNWVGLGKTANTRFELQNVKDGTSYGVRARALNSLGVKSGYAVADHAVVGTTAAPADVTGFSINIVGADAFLSWDAVTDLDLDHYEIRYTPDNDSPAPTYAESAILVPKVSPPATSVTVPAAPGTYFIKAVDLTGNESETAASVATNVDAILGLNAVSSVEQSTLSPAWPGVKNATRIDGSALVLSQVNHLLYSEQFDNSEWTLRFVTVSADATTDPEGDSDADQIVLNSTTNDHRALQNFNAYNGQTYTCSVYVKYNDWQYIQLNLGAANFPTSSYANFDIQNGAIGDEGADLPTGGASIEDIGSGWYRVSITQTADSSGVNSFNIAFVEASTSPLNQNFLGDGASSFYAWGAQVERGSAPSTYLETTTATAAATYLTSGEYYFDAPVDLGGTFTSRLTAQMQLTRFEDSGLLFDDAGGLFDARGGFFDGGSVNFSDVDAQLWVRTTSDDPNGSPVTWSAWLPFFVGDYTARGFEFKVVMTTENESATPRISALKVNVDMPDRVYAVADTASGTAAGGKQVSFSPAFKETPTVVITPQDLTTGDYYEIVSKSASDCYVRFRDSGGTVIDRTFDLVAKGYGQ